MKGGFLLDVVIAERATVLELLAGEDQALLVRGNTARAVSIQIDSNESCENSPFLVLDFGFDIVDGVGGFNLESDGFTREAAR